MAQKNYAKFDHLPLGELIPLTALTGDVDRYGDYAEGSYCQWPVGLPCTRSRDVLVGGHVISLLVAS